MTRIVLEGPTAMSIGEPSSEPSPAPIESTEVKRDDAIARPRHGRLRTLLGAILSFAIFWYAGWLLRVPANPGFSGSLLQQPSPMGAMLIVIGLVAACAMLATLITGGDRDAGMLCAAFGLFALSARSGPMRFTLMAGAGPQVYLALACETIALGGVLVLARMALGVLAPNPARESHEAKQHEEQIDQKLIGVLTGVITFVLAMLLLSQTDKKQQVVAGVAIASFIATIVSVAYFIAPRSVGSGWFWCVPIIVGVVGYLGTYFINPSGWDIGAVRGFLAPLARPLPIDYASAGVAAAIFAHRLARAWQVNHGEKELAVELGEADEA